MNPMGQGGGMGPLGMLITPWVKRVMITTAVLSIVGAIALMWMGSNVPLHLGLQPRSVWGGGDLPIPALWQILTYPFLALHPIALLLAILMYGWFGGTLESWWGSPRFFKFYFGITALSAVVTVLLSFFWPALAAERFLGPYPILGAMIVAWGLTFPDREVRLFFVLPVKGIHIVWISVGITVLYVIFSGSVAPFVPHIVAMAASALTVTGAWRGRRVFLQMRKLQIQAQIRREEEARKKRLAKAGHLRVVDPKEGDPEADDKDGKGKNGAGSGGWLH
jgi:membrane associated rhomboid family serine protease